HLIDGAGPSLMAYNSLREFVQVLERENELKRIGHPVKAELEIAEISDRVMKRGGPALLFENVVGQTIPVLINAFGSARRMALALGVNDVGDIAGDIERLTRLKPPGSWRERFQLLPQLLRLAGVAPKLQRDGACQEVIDRDPDLSSLPVLTCWPGDAGPFITLPQVFYRRTTGMHWHPHKVGARHYKRQKEGGGRMELAACIGGDPALTYAATA